MEPVTSVGAGLAILGSKDILTKILGPSAEYIGGEVAGFVEKCNINLNTIFNCAHRKLGNRLEEEGTVNSRVLKHVLDEGRFCEDQLTAEYYGGILASSKTDTGRDDRGVAVTATLNLLSTYQIRAHYLCYYLFHKLHQKSELTLGRQNNEMKIFIPASVYEAAMDFTDNEIPSDIVTHSIVGLVRQGLLYSDYSIGSLESMQKQYSNAQEQGIIVAPTTIGSEMFFWGLGFKGSTGYELTKQGLDIGEPSIVISDGACKIQS